MPLGVCFSKRLLQDWNGARRLLDVVDPAAGISPTKAMASPLLSEGFDGYVAKPVLIDVLLDEMKKVLAV